MHRNRATGSSSSLEVSVTFRMGGRTQPPYPLHRVFAEGAWLRQRNRCASLSSCSSPISDARCADTDASMSELASSDARLTQSSNGSDGAMTDVEENVPSAGQGVMGSVSSELPPILQLQPMFPVWEICMQCPVQLLAVPAHCDWTHGHTCVVCGHTADSAACRQFLQAAITGCAWLAKFASTRAREA